MTTALVLGAAVRADGTASPTLTLRVGHAVDLYRAGRVTAICMSGGQGHRGPPEAHVARDLAIAMGVPEAAILTEDLSRNTCENIALARPMIASPAILVSNRWHLPRAWLIARLIGWPVRVSGPKGTVPWPRTILAILREIAAIPLTAVRTLRSARRSGR